MYKRQHEERPLAAREELASGRVGGLRPERLDEDAGRAATCLLYTSDAADERSSVDLGGRRIIKKKKAMTCTETEDLSNEYRQQRVRVNVSETHRAGE